MRSLALYWKRRTLMKSYMKSYNQKSTPIWFSLEDSVLHGPLLSWWAPQPIMVSWFERGSHLRLNNQLVNGPVSNDIQLACHISWFLFSPIALKPMGARPLSGSLWGFDSWSALGGWIWWALGGGCCPILQHRSRFPGRGNKQLSIGAICFLLEWNTRLLSDSKRFQKVNSAPRTKAFDWCQCLKVIASKHVLKSRSRWCDWFTWALFPNANNGRLLLPNIRYNHAHGPDLRAAVC